MARYWIVNRNGAVELRVAFSSKPADATRLAIKAAGFRYDGRNQAWHAPLTDERLAIAARYAEPKDSGTPRPAPQPATSAAKRPAPAAQQPATSFARSRSATSPEPAASGSPALGGLQPSVDLARYYAPDPEPKGPQKAVVEHTQGPMLVIAGPGTGKTATMVNRVARLVLVEGVAPSQVMVATFSNKAAKELLTRISNYFAGIPAAANLKVHEMRIGTFHSLCLDILREYAQEAGLRNYTVLNENDVKFQMFADKDVDGEGFCRVLERSAVEGRGDWDRIEAFSSLLDIATEGEIVPEAFRQSGDEALRGFAEPYEYYRENLARNGALTFADIQAETLRLLRGNPRVLAELQDQIHYIIVDEYQDTNPVQEKLVFALAGNRKNICVVGDDDQALYRFRGATVRNILNFDGKFEGGVAVERLEVNYRSQEGIVGFCNKWMDPAQCGLEEDLAFEWNGCRREKSIRPWISADNPKTADQVNPVSVVRCAAGNMQAWFQRVADLLFALWDEGQLRDWNQVAFIGSSVTHPAIRGLIAHLEGRGIPCYAPRAGMFLRRPAVACAVGCLMLCVAKMKYGSNLAGTNDEDYQHCLEVAEGAVAEDTALRAWVERSRSPYADTATGLLSLFYEMLQFEPFRACLTTGGAMGLADTLEARDLAGLASLIAGFSALEHARNQREGRRATSGLGWMAYRFFTAYLSHIKGKGRLYEYEDEEEYAPSGHVSFLTAHQAKGMEFPVVVACSLFEKPWGGASELEAGMRALSPDWGTSPEDARTAEDIEKFDFWRKYYVEFSRAQDLLVLSSMGRAPRRWGGASDLDPSGCFSEICASADIPDVSEVDLSAVQLRPVKPAAIKKQYAFTSDVAEYERCPRRYKLLKLFGFPSASMQSQLFGTLVHQSVEDIHRAVLECGVDGVSLGEEAIEATVAANCASLEQVEGAQLKSRMSDAVKQVRNYLENNGDIWRNVKEAEVSVSDVRGDYILTGQIDLLADAGTEGTGDSVVIVDFKTGKMPRDGSPILEKYRKQMHVYAHLVKEQLGYDVAGAKLYFTGDTAGRPVRDIPLAGESVDANIAEFDDVVGKIESGDFAAQAADPGECRECPMAFYCDRAT